ncbi:hypothetical protein [Antarcticirhabdus aurantiaca]|uniref:hypothetical protein n=1 Tax=Antarcticirhabdus aurantiaca TaxID=2606717 RepID=UPI00131DEE11|nr:hypothetical protein [Antarcticirhabdus aurantiaca]
MVAGELKKVTPTRRSREERRRQCEYSARHRERIAGTPDMRLVDRTLVEALAEHLRSQPVEVTEPLTRALVDLAVGGLVHAGIDKRTAERSVGKRIQYWLSCKPRGTVKPSVYRALEPKSNLTP